MGPGPMRSALLALVDFITLGFMGLLAYFSVTIIERMHTQTMTVFELPMSIVYAGVGLGCFMMLARQIRWCGAMRAAAGAGRTTSPTNSRGLRTGLNRCRF